MLRAVTLKQDGSINEDSEMANFTLKIDGTEVASTTSSNGGYVTFNLKDVYTITDGKTVEFKVYADIVGGADETIKFVIEKPLDITAYGSKYAGINVDITDNTVLQTLTVQAGEVTLIAIDPTTTDIRKDKDDIVL